LWSPLDRKGKQRIKYNRFAVTRLEPAHRRQKNIEFRTRGPSLLFVSASPTHPKLWAIGARYVLTFGKVPEIADLHLELLYRSKDRGFSIWRIPHPKGRGGARVAGSRPRG
jgi:hypothetical protein